MCARAPMRAHPFFMLHVTLGVCNSRTGAATGFSPRCFLHLLLQLKE